VAGTDDSEPIRSIFITGAASGIGRATAIRFGEDGWYIGGVDVDEAGLDSLREELGGESKCFIRRLDVSDKAAYDAIMESFSERSGGRLDILFNNAGMGGGGFIDDLPYEVAMRIIQTNLIGTVNGIYAALPLLRCTPNSLCFSTSSSAAIYGLPKVAIYSASKFAVKGLTEALSAELARHDIRAADVLPGVIDTPILDGTPDYSGGEPPGVAMRKSATAEGAMRMMQPGDVAEVVMAAYGSDKVHWYVPAELAGLEDARVGGVEGLRDHFRHTILEEARK
jgi:NAD(P)-dependent dehydrogenase (short-subunit alcohol dehydrogenase family)